MLQVGIHQPPGTLSIALPPPSCSAQRQDRFYCVEISVTINHIYFNSSYPYSFPNPTAFLFNECPHSFVMSLFFQRLRCCGPPVCPSQIIPPAAAPGCVPVAYEPLWQGRVWRRRHVWQIFRGTGRFGPVVGWPVLSGNNHKGLCEGSIVSASAVIL